MTEQKKHAKFSASGAHRWLACPGSVKLAESCPPSRESKYALEGTNAHECVEMLLKNPNKRHATEELLKKKFGLQMMMDARSAVETIERMKPKGAILLSETKSDLSFIHPEMWGTADAVIVDEFGTLTVIDFKYGQGIAVDVKDNAQLAFYALGVAHKYHYNFADVCMVVIQPRADHPDGPTRKWTIPIEELRGWGKRFAEGIVNALDTPRYEAGSHCKFCPAAIKCPEISKNALIAARADFPDDGPVVLPDAKLSVGRDLGQTLTLMERIEFWISETRAHAYNVLSDGGEVPGWKLVEKRGTRKWLSAEKVAAQAKKKFGAKAFTKPELLSPAQLEKVADKAWVNERCSNVSSGLTLAPETDPRPGTNQAQLDFKD